MEFIQEDIQEQSQQFENGQQNQIQQEPVQLEIQNQAIKNEDEIKSEEDQAEKELQQIKQEDLDDENQIKQKWTYQIRDQFPNIDQGVSDFKEFIEILRSYQAIKTLGSVFIISSGNAQEESPKQIGFSCRYVHKEKCPAGFKLKRQKSDDKLYLFQENNEHLNHPKLETESQVQQCLSFLNRRKKISSTILKNKNSKDSKRKDSQSSGEDDDIFGEILEQGNLKVEENQNEQGEVKRTKRKYVRKNQQQNGDSVQKVQVLGEDQQQQQNNGSLKNNIQLNNELNENEKGERSGSEEEESENDSELYGGSGIKRTRYQLSKMHWKTKQKLIKQQQIQQYQQVKNLDEDQKKTLFSIVEEIENVQSQQEEMFDEMKRLHSKQNLNIIQFKQFVEKALKQNQEKANSNSLAKNQSHNSTNYINNFENYEKNTSNGAICPNNSENANNDENLQLKKENKKIEENYTNISLLKNEQSENNTTLIKNQDTGTIINNNKEILNVVKTNPNLVVNNSTHVPTNQTFQVIKPQPIFNTVNYQSLYNSKIVQEEKQKDESEEYEVL